MPAYWRYRMNHNFRPVLWEYRNHRTAYLEIGVLTGRTAEWMFENILIHPKSYMVGIDPVIEPLKNMINKYGKRMQIIQGLSQNVIPAKVKSGRWKNESIDIVYIDGDHSPDAIKRDFEMCWPLLKINGVLIFDDYEINIKVVGAKIKNMIDSIIKEYSSKLCVIFKNRQLGIRKIAV
jgi:predicted O-methyltransferase YrrM